MPKAWDPSEICRDEDCLIVGAHRPHLVAERPPPAPHHRPKKRRPDELMFARTPWHQADPRGLRGAVARAVSKTPKVFHEIVRDVRDDYGNVTERTIHRHLKALTERKQTIKLDLGFTFAVYIRPKSRMLKNIEAIRDYIEGEISLDNGSACTGTVRYARANELAPA